jgi:hypothetical protein
VVQFISKLPPVPIEVVRGFVEACAVPGVTHFSQAFRLTESNGLSYWRVLAALPDQALRVIRETFAARRKAEIEGRKRLRRFQAQMHRVLAADACRGRKLKRLLESFETSREGSGVDSTSEGAAIKIQGTGAFFRQVPQEVTK